MKKDNEYLFDDQYIEKLYSETPNPKITEVLKAVEQGSFSWKAQLIMLKILLNSYKDDLLDIKRIKIENPNLNLLDTDNDRWYNWLKNDCKKRGIEYNVSREDYEKEFRKSCYEDDIDYESECKSDFEFYTELLEYKIECIDNEIKKIETFHLTETGSEQEATPESATQPEKRKNNTRKVKDKNLQLLNLLKIAIIKTAKDKDGNHLKLTELPKKEYMQYYRACVKMFPDIQLQDLNLDTVLSEIEKNK